MNQDNRRTQMKWLIALTATSLMPVYGLLGYQTGPHGAKDVWAIIWTIEAVAWSLRALIEAWAIVYLFSTNTTNKKAQRQLTIIEIALIALIGLTVTLLVVANKNSQSINELWWPLFWLWAASVASFAPLMFAGVGIAYRVHEPIANPQPIVDTTQKDIVKLRSQLDDVLQRLETPHNPVVVRREAIREALNSENPPTHKALAKLYKVSEGTIGNDVKALNGQAGAIHKNGNGWEVIP